MPSLTPFLLCSLLVLLLSPTDPAARLATRRTLRVMTFNIHHGEGTDGKIDLERIAALIREQRADVVALQEVDRGVERTARRDLIAELARLTNMGFAFGKNITHQGGDYGNAILTRFPILEQGNHHFAMLRPGEQRGLLRTLLNVAGRNVLLLNTHLDHRPDDAERLSSVAEINRLLSTKARLPVILSGDFNDLPGSPTHSAVRGAFLDSWDVVGKGEGFTYPSGNPGKRIDYVFVKKGAPLKPLWARVISSDASDHLALIVEIEIN